MNENRTHDALPHFDLACQEHPADHKVRFLYGKALSQCGNLPQAVAQLAAALKIKPDYLDALVTMGMTLVQAGLGDQAKPVLSLSKSLIDQAIKSDPHDLGLLTTRGNVFQWQGLYQDAIDTYRNVLDRAPGHAHAAANMAMALRCAGHMDQAINANRKAIGLMPESAELWINMGILFQGTARHKDALDAFDKALAIAPSSVLAKWNKAASLLACGDYEQGWPFYETGLGIAGMRAGANTLSNKWNGEDIKNRRLLIKCEQGLGDALQFIRYAALCKERGAFVVVSCPKTLDALFSNCPFIDETSQEADTPYDFQIPLMSLPFVFKTTVDTIPANMPYLFPAKDAVKKWGAKIAGGHGKKIGLVWAGNPRKEKLLGQMIDSHRSIGLETLRPLLDISGTEFFSLQMGAEAEQIGRYGLCWRIRDPMPDVQDFQDTAAIVSYLDLVITVDTSVAHLAGGLGKPVWILSRYDACWRWLQNRPDSPWYPTAKIFGQEKSGDWASVIAKVRDELRAMIDRTT